MIRYGDRRHPKETDLADERGNAIRPIQEAVLSMQVEVDELLCGWHDGGPLFKIVMVGWGDVNEKLAVRILADRGNGVLFAY